MFVFILFFEAVVNLACGFWKFAYYGNELEQESFETRLTKHDAKHVMRDTHTPHNHPNESRSQFGKRTKIMKMLIGITNPRSLMCCIACLSQCKLTC